MSGTRIIAKFSMSLNLSITSRNKIYGSRSENTGLVRTLKFECMNVLQNVFY